MDKIFSLPLDRADGDTQSQPLTLLFQSAATIKQIGLETIKNVLVRLDGVLSFDTGGQSTSQNSNLLFT